MSKIKVICIDPGATIPLTKGKQYEVEETTNEYYFMTIDNGEERYVLKSRFKKRTWEIGDSFKVTGGSDIIYTIEKDESSDKWIQTTWVDNSGEKHSVCYEIENADKYVDGDEPVWILCEKYPLLLCVNMNDSVADFTVGKVYELRTEDDEYYYFKRDDAGVGGGGMFKHRFVKLTDKTVTIDEYPYEVVCVDNLGYENKLTLGKTYKVKDSEFRDSIYVVETNDLGHNGLSQVLKSRFKVITNKVVDKSTPEKPTPKKKMVCIDNKGYEDHLTIDKEYEILKEDDDYYTIKNDEGNEGGYRKRRFKEPVSEFTIEVKCINNFGYESKLTIGKIYMAKNFDDTLYTIETNDKDGEIRAFKHRFELVQQSEENLFKIGDQFIYNSTEGIVYTIAEETPRGDMRIEWIGGDGNKVSNMYTVDYINEAIKKGNWIIKNNNPEPTNDTRETAIEKTYVKCIDNSHGALSLTVGKIYEVTDGKYSYNYKLINDRGDEEQYNKSRFEKVNAMRCVTIDGLITDRDKLTVGKLYEVKQAHDHDMFDVIDDTGGTRTFFKYRFAR
jgi:hypothetical protein